jgi:diacylglycerol kinase family enzyme
MSARRRQFVAIGAIVAGVAALIAAVALFWNEWVALLVAVACVVIATIAAWYVLSRRGVTRLIASLVMLAALVGALGALVRDHSLWRIGLVLVLGLSAAALARFALSGTKKELRAKPPPGVHVGAATKPVLVANPKSGGGKANESFLAEARARGIETVVLHPGDDLEQLARDAIAHGVDVIGMAGGDGSQALVATIAAEHDLPFVCIPAGTRNHFALDLGIDREDVVGALDAFVDGYERRVDLAAVNGRVFVNNVSLGLYAAIVQSDEYREAKMGTAAKMLPDLLGNGYSQFDFEIEGPNALDGANPDLVLVSNNVYELSGIGGFGTREHLDEGVLGVIAISVKNASDLAQLIALETAKRGSSFAGWHEWSDRTLVIRSSKPVDSGIDGEAVSLEPPVRFEVRPGALRVRLAPHHPGVSPAAITGTVRRGGLRGLLEVALGRTLAAVSHRSAGPGPDTEMSGSRGEGRTDSSRGTTTSRLVETIHEGRNFRRRSGWSVVAARLRRFHGNAEIRVVDRGPYVSFAICGLPSHVRGMLLHSVLKEES